MIVIIVGCGRVGSAVANRLNRQGHEVTVVDVDRHAFDNLDPGFKGTALLGDGIDQDVLRSAGIDRADAFVAAMFGDNHNLMAAQMAKAMFKVSRVVSRCQDPVRMEAFETLGLVMVSPAVLTANALHEAVMNEALHQNLDVVANIDQKLRARGGGAPAGGEAP